MWELFQQRKKSSPIKIFWTYQSQRILENIKLSYTAATLAKKIGKLTFSFLMNICYFVFSFFFHEKLLKVRQFNEGTHWYFSNCLKKVLAETSSVDVVELMFLSCNIRKRTKNIKRLT